MSILAEADDKRNFAVPQGQEFVLSDNTLPEEDKVLRTLDDLSEAINLIDPETFEKHVNGEKNDFASWVEHVFGEAELANQLRAHPTPLRMMVTIEKFLRINEKTAQPA